MRLLLASVSPRGARARSAAADALTAEYLGRIAGWLKPAAQVFPSEDALLTNVARLAREPGGAALALFDSRGKPLTSEGFAAWLGKRRETFAGLTILAIGPPDGWSAKAAELSQESLSLGAMTLPHELARAVAAEQIYRAWTILERHPYHCGH